MAPQIVRLAPGSGDRWRRLRLRALQEAPYAFGTTFAEASRWPSARWQQQVEEIATFVAVLAGDDVGVARCVPQPERPQLRELISMWVAPEARRRDVGSALIHAVAGWAGSQGASALVLDVLEDNSGAIAFYARLGFDSAAEALGAPEPGERRMTRATVAG